MPEINGLDLLAAMNERRVSMPVIMITGQGNAQLASPPCSKEHSIFSTSRSRLTFCSLPFAGIDVRG